VGYNPYIVVPLATWAVAQISKFAVAALRGRVDLRYLYASGGMPSVHSAVVTSLATTAALVDGLDSHLFGVTVILAAIVMYDSFGVRRSSGEQAMAINMLIDSLGRDRVKLDRPDLHLREILGHQPREVTVGALLGIFLAGLFNYDKLGGLTTFMQTLPARPELIAYLAVFAVILLGGLVTRFVLVARYKKSRTMRKLAQRILTATQVVGWLGLVSVVFVYERASYLSWRLWPLLILAIGVVWGIWIATSSYKVVPASLASEADEARKRKWLNWGKEKNRRRK
jgi:acid phosphatase family membrane protein YuiD